MEGVAILQKAPVSGDHPQKEDRDEEEEVPSQETK